MKFLSHQPKFNGRGYPVRKIQPNINKLMDGLPWLVIVECFCDICRRGDGPGDDWYDVSDTGQALQHRSPADITL